MNNRRQRIQFLFITLLILVINVESRAFDGSDNNLKNPTSGIPSQSFQRNYPPQALFGADGDSMIKSPSDIVFADPTQPIPKCTGLLPVDTYPMPRCVSNILTNYNLQPYNFSQISDYRSKRQTSHLITFFAQFISFDITDSSTMNPSIPMYIPADDAIYNSPKSIPGQLSATTKFLPFNRSDFSTAGTTKRNGINNVTPFLDLSPLYGISIAESNMLRDLGNRGRMKTNGGSPTNSYPIRNQTTGSYIMGTHSTRSNNIFTLAILTIWLREHNRLCDELYDIHGDTWTDDQYFEEARKWNIAFYQKVVTEEYLGVVLGQPLPQYQKYDPALTPGIDLFFSTITFRYGHTELSDYYHIKDKYGDIVKEIPLSDIFNMDLLESFDLVYLIRSMSVQRQEEVDSYYTDSTRNVITPEPNTYDVGAFDLLRSRDRGIQLYNNVRQAYGLARKKTWAEITSITKLQYYLNQLYPNGPDSLEAFVGAMVEDHLVGSNFGELLSTSINSDRFWWQNTQNNLFTADEMAVNRNTTFKDIIIRNLPEDVRTAVPQNIWTVQPVTKVDSPRSSDYPGVIELWTTYLVSYKIVGENINFKVQLETVGGEGWFGMGFSPDDDGMKGADFVIGIVSNGNITLKNYRAAGMGYHPPIVDDNGPGLAISKNEIVNNLATIEFARPLSPGGRKGINNGPTKYILAYNPGSSQISYHSNNRQFIIVDFYNHQISASAVTKAAKLAKLSHGVGMFLTWSVLFPISIFIVRYYKHTNNYVKIHRFAQLLGGISVGSFGAAAMTTISLISIWSQAFIVSVNQGYPRFLKRIHKFFGVSLLLSAWVNVYLGIYTFCTSYGHNPLPYTMSYLLLVSVTISAFIFGQYYWRWGTRWNIRKLKKNHKGGFEKDTDEEESKSILFNYITMEKYNSLPEFTWDELNERVQRGAYLVICDGLIFDIRKWIEAHPGGAKILERVIGTDITNEFFGYNTVREIIEEVDEPDVPPLSTGASDSVSPVLGKYTNLLRERNKKNKLSYNKRSVAKIFDNVNVKYFLKSPLAVHSHSLFAAKKLSTLIVARLKENDYINPSSSPITPQFGPFNDDGQIYSNKESAMSDLDITKHEAAFRVKFHRYKLTSRMLANNNKKQPVIKFTFTKVYQNDKDSIDYKFLPGQYIEVQSRIKGQVVIRPYTPIEGKIIKSFSIFVKIYPGGLMSQHLNDQLIGYEIQVRGPFDIGDRINLTSPALPQSADFKTAYRKSVLSMPTSPSNISHPRSFILNPNNVDGTWDQLYMICGGTGISPMLQYHLEINMKYAQQNPSLSNKRASLHLLFGNRAIVDIIDGIELEELAINSNNFLNITYLLSHPPEGWLGIEGRLDQLIIDKWLKSQIGMVNHNNDNKDKSVLISSNNNNKKHHHSKSNSLNDSLSNIASSVIHKFSNSNLRKYPPESNHIPSKLGPNSKIFVCGPPNMMIAVEKSLKNLGYHENEFILLI
ncbi:9752_t:CDS:10 [Entrophospora sp. SA101]|nr:9752_t:CDS:10 [Entrophospora sp. SA101]